MRRAAACAQMRGLARITLKPLTDELPCIGAVTVTLMDAPYVDFTLRLMGSFDLMQIPGVNYALSYGMEMVRRPEGQALGFGTRTLNLDPTSLWDRLWYMR